MTAPHATRHLFGIDNLSDADLATLLGSGEKYAALFKEKRSAPHILEGHIVLNLFFEPSTRTHVSFEIAAKRLGADVINVATANMSSAKGETLEDTAVALNAMRPSAFIIRHKDTDALKRFAAHVACPVINAGNGTGEHPTQALLDAMTIMQAKGQIEGLKIAICGDILHSRVAHSNIKSLTRLGAHVNVVAPRELLDESVLSNSVTAFTDMKAGLQGCDIVMSLRLQRERMATPLSLSPTDYFRDYGLTNDALRHAKPDALVLDPGPVIRGSHIGDDVVDGARNLIAKQVENGVAMRAAVLAHFIGQGGAHE